MTRPCLCQSAPELLRQVALGALAGAHENGIAGDPIAAVQSEESDAASLVFDCVIRPSWTSMSLRGQLRAMRRLQPRPSVRAEQ